MKEFLFLLCFLGVVPATRSVPQTMGHKYYLIMTNVTRPAAQTYCRTTYDDLATVESDHDWVRLKAEVARAGPADVAWVGLYNNINSWRWSFNDVPLKNTYEQWNFYENEPNNKGGHESCVITGPAGYWWDYPCSSLYPFICYSANNNYTDRYVGVTTKLTWNGAQAYCREFHTDLATAYTQTDNNAMKSIAYSVGSSWIGLYRDTWKWSDGTNASNLRWLPGQPDNFYQDENCAVLTKEMFDDRKCTNRDNFICHTEHPVREQQMMRLQVKSVVNIIDSYARDILELIERKLEERGMLKDTSVTWRVQSDGQIFHKNKE